MLGSVMAADALALQYQVTSIHNVVSLTIVHDKLHEIWLLLN